MHQSDSTYNQIDIKRQISFFQRGAKEWKWAFFPWDFKCSKLCSAVSPITEHFRPHSTNHTQDGKGLTAYFLLV
jgi:hypothetical protein